MRRAPLTALVLLLSVPAWAQDNPAPGDAAPGGVRITSEPAGALVVIDGEIACRATPCEVAIQADMKTMAMFLELHETRRGPVPSEDTSWDLEPKFGYLSVGSSPTGATVFLNGEIIGSAPLAGVRVPVGEHVVQVGGDRCHLPVKTRIRVAAGGREHVQSQVETTLSGVEVRSFDGEGNVVGARVIVDGKELGTAPGVVAVPTCSTRLEVAPLEEEGPRRRMALVLEPRSVARFDVILVGGLSGRGPVTVTRGVYRIGKPGSGGRPGAEPVLDVELTYDVWVQNTEVTQQQWLDLMGHNPSGFGTCGLDCPVERVNWFDAAVYTNKLSEAEGLEPCYELTGCTGEPGTGCSPGSPQCDGAYECKVRFAGLQCTGYRLPTETEWEVAAAGDGVIGDPRDIGWFQVNSENKSHPVGGKAPNSLGMFDVFGNVSEWTHDYWGTRPTDRQTDWAGPPTGTNRVCKGSAYLSPAEQLRPAYRYGVNPDFRGKGLGFRIARTVR